MKTKIHLWYAQSDNHTKHTDRQTDRGTQVGRRNIVRTTHIHTDRYTHSYNKDTFKLLCRAYSRAPKHGSVPWKPLYFFEARVLYFKSFYFFFQDSTLFFLTWFYFNCIINVHSALDFICCNYIISRAVSQAFTPGSLILNWLFIYLN